MRETAYHVAQGAMVVALLWFLIGVFFFPDR